jgi:AcrR family transcriptional regulator
LTASKLSVRGRNAPSEAGGRARDAPSEDGGRARDAERSRAAILAAAEELFAEHGFRGTSLGDIGAAAGLSRGTPSYFYGSKEQLYAAVLEQVFAARESATAAAFAPVHAWAAGGGGSLEGALADAVRGYMAFLLARPTFLRLLEWEELAGGARLRGVPRASHAIEDAFAALRGAARRRGLRPFRVDDAVLLFVSLTFSPLTQRSTCMAALGHDLSVPATARRHVALVVDQLLHLVR